MSRLLAAVLLACAPLALGASGDGRDAAAAKLLERLPPGIRPPDERAGLVWSDPEAGSARGPRVIEVVDDPDADAGASDWFQVEYTVDPRLDEHVRGVLERSGALLGHVIVLDAANGAVLSYVSTDPVRFPATRTYPTASLMKVVTAAAVLRHAPDATTRDCRYAGSPYRLRLAHLGPVPRGGRFDSFWHALAVSNNQCFARLAVHDLGAEALLDEVRRTGLLEEPALRHAPGRVEPVEDPLDLGQLGSGLSGSFITPLAAARLAGLLTEGELVRPFWIAGVRDAYGDPVPLPEPSARPVWDPRLAGELRELLVAVTERGTARSAFRNGAGRPLLGPVRVSGKTGTLSGQDPEGLYQWFIGVAPAEAPRVAIAAVVVDGPSGAAEVAADVLREVFCEDGSCDPSRAERLRPRPGHEGARERRSVAAEDLDALPRPLGATGLELPSRLRRDPVRGEIVLLLELDSRGQVLDVRVASSDLADRPELEAFVASQVASWRFTPPTQRGRPVRARARLPVPIRIE